MSTRRSLFVLVLLLLSTLSHAQWPGDMVGWRQNGIGNYPDAAPPVSWGPEANVVWQTKLPNWGNANPVIVGKLIVTTCEENTLLGLDIETGELLWQVSVDYADFEATPAAQEEARRKMAVAVDVRKEEARLNSDLHKVRRDLRKDKDNAELKAREDKLKTELNTLRKERLAPVNEYALPNTHGANGYASQTPVSNGRHVWAYFGTGILICCDLDGKLLWKKRVETPPHGWGGSSSPLYVDGKILLHVNSLVAYDAGTGEELWTARLPWKWGTNALMPMDDGMVVFTSKGHAVNVANGEVITGGLHNGEWNGPVRIGRRIYYIENWKKTPAQVYDVPATIAELAKGIKPVWEQPIRDERYYGEPLVRDGLIYTINQKQHLSVLEETTGQIVYERDLETPAATVYSSPTGAGKYVYLTNEKGYTTVIEAGREYKEVARNELEPVRTCPIFIGKRMYVRGRNHVWCIGE